MSADVAALVLHVQQHPDDERAKNELIRSQTGLVKWVLGKLGVGMTFETVAAGQIGLFEAARRWDPAKSKWSTYAYLWVRKYVYLELRHDVGARDTPVDDSDMPLATGDHRDDLDDAHDAQVGDERKARLYAAIASLPPDVELAARCKFGLHDNAEPNPQLTTAHCRSAILRMVRQIDW